MAEPFSSLATAGNNAHQQRQSLLNMLDALPTRTLERHFVVSGMHNLFTTTYISSNSNLDAVIDIFPPEVVFNLSCVSLEVLYDIFRNLLLPTGISIERLHEFFIPRALIDKLFEGFSSLHCTTSWLIAYFKLSVFQT